MRSNLHNFLIVLLFKHIPEIRAYGGWCCLYSSQWVLCRLLWHRDTVCDVQWSPRTPTRIATASFDRSVVVWDFRADPSAAAPQLEPVSLEKMSASLSADASTDSAITIDADPRPLFVLPHSGRALRYTSVLSEASRL
jgi:WD40 repeat protein